MYDVKKRVQTLEDGRDRALDRIQEDVSRGVHGESRDSRRFAPWRLGLYSSASARRETGA